MHFRILVREALVWVALVVVTASAEQAPLIEGVAGEILGPACALPSLTRAVNASYGLALPPYYLRGLSGDAMLATVCQNNCGCRDYREMQLRVLPALEAIGVEAVYVAQHEFGAEKSWEVVANSISAGRPAVVFNLFGDMEDVPLVGFDEVKDRAWGLRSDGSTAYASVELAAWKSGEIYGYVLPPARKEVDLRRAEMAALFESVVAERRPLLDGG